MDRVDIDAFARAIDLDKLDEAQFVKLMEVLDFLSVMGTGIELASMRTETFVWLIGKASRGQLEHMMEQPNLRGVVLAEVFRRMTNHVKADRATASPAVVHWRFSGGAGDGGFDRYQTVIEDGTCVSGTDPTRDPRATITLAPADFLRAATGNVSVPLLFVRGRVKVKGDIPFAAGITGYFDLPKP